MQCIVCIAIGDHAPFYKHSTALWVWLGTTPQVCTQCGRHAEPIGVSPVYLATNYHSKLEVITFNSVSLKSKCQILYSSYFLHITPLNKASRLFIIKALSNTSSSRRTDPGRTDFAILEDILVYFEPVYQRVCVCGH